MTIRISVVVPTYRRPEFLERCLAALATQDFERGAYEIVVADDGPDERTRAQVQRWAAGPAGARNRGWRAARGDIIAFTDDDTVPQRDWLAEGEKAMAGGASAVAGRVRVPLPADRDPTDYERDIRNMETAEFVTANCFVRRPALEAVGGFDERFTSAWREDSDLQFMLLQKQGNVESAPRAVVDHPVRPVSDWTYGLRQHRKIAFDALLFKKHPELYRRRIRGAPPWGYYAVVASLAGVGVGAFAGMPRLAWAAFALWLALTGRFAARRLRGTSKAPAHVAEMVVTSMVIPPVAIYWRLVGAWRYRVLFL